MKKRKSRRKRLKHAIKAGKNAYRRGKTSKLRRVKNLLLGKNAKGYAARVGIVGATGAGLAVHKVSGNIKRSGQNFENASEAIKKTTQNVEKSTANIRKVTDVIPNTKAKAKELISRKSKKDINKRKEFFSGVKKKAKGYIDRKKAEGIAARKKRLGFSTNSNTTNLNFMSRYTGYANFSEEELEYALEAALEEIEEQFQNGELTEDEADDLEDDIAEEYEEALDELEEEDYDDEEFEGSVYQGQLANFSAATDLGECIMEYIVEVDPEDPEETILDLAESLQLVDEEGYELEGEEAVEGVLGLMSGEIIPDESLLMGLAEYFDFDEDEADEIIDLTEDELEAEGYLDDDYDDDDYDEEIEADYEEEGYDDDYVDELEEDIDELEDELDEVGEVAEQAFSRIQSMEAQFAMAQEEREISADFNALEEEAYALVESGQMPPAIFEDNYGNFEDAESQLAAFSQVCQSNGVDFEAELHRLDGINESYAEMEPDLSLSQFSYSDSNYEDYDVDDATLAQAARNVRSRNFGQEFGKPMNFGQPDNTSVATANAETQPVNSFGTGFQQIGLHSRGF